MSAEAERRRWPRILFEQTVALKVRQDIVRELTGTSRDLSAGGMFLHVYKEVPKGATVELLFAVPPGLQLERRPVVMSGTVVRVEQSFPNGRYGIAIAFQLQTTVRV